MSETPYKVQVEFDDTVDRAFFKTQVDLHQLESEELEESGFETLDPVSASILIGGAVVLAGVIASAVEQWRGGTVIDMRVEPPVVRRDKGVLLGVMVIFAADGSVDVKVEDMPKTSLERLTEGVISAGKEITMESVKGLIGQLPE